MEYAKAIQPGLVKGNEDEPIAQNTIFGWIITGDEGLIDKINITALISTTEIDKKLATFFKSEEMEDEDQKISEEETFCERHFVETHKRDINGKYIVKMPFKNNVQPNLGNSRKIAVATLLQLEKRFQRQPELYTQYKNFIHEYINLGHMKIAFDRPKEMVYYLPHHPVFKESTTTKVRTVLNASQKTDNGYSLNDLAMGKIKQRDITALLIQWRQFQFAFTADVEKMYSQIWIVESQQDFIRILWRDSPNETIKEYKLQTVTYGTAPAPFLAIRVLLQIANDIEHLFPRAAQTIREAFYMDDMCSGAHSITEAKEIYVELQNAMNQAGFNLRKWSTNCEELRKIIPESQQELQTNNDKIKMLGLTWNTSSDMFEITLKLVVKFQPKSKRELLSEVASLYDPLGWIAPVVIKAKIMLQELWKQNLGWDDDLSPTTTNECMKLKNEIRHIQNIKIPRWTGTAGNDKVELHGYCDSSEAAYAAVMYMRHKNKSTLIITKTKVAPIKKLTIPRLELCGALLLARLMKQVLTNSKIKFSKIHFWTDSKIVLAWINGNPKRWTTFVMNQVIKINAITPKEDWGYISTKSNPADCASRGIYGSELVNHALWWSGPKYNEMYNEMKNETFETKEEIKNIVTLMTCEENYGTILPDVSDFNKMIRIVAYVKRFIHNCKNPNIKIMNELTTIEMENAKMNAIKIIQEEYFKEDIENLKKDKNINKNSALLKLSVFLNEKGILCVGGRLKNADIALEAKHPILLPNRNKFTDLIITMTHVKTCKHGGPRLTEAVIRQEYWIIKSFSNIKRVISKCVTCFRYRSKPLQQNMADLSSERVNIVEKIFYNTALDYAGPVKTKASKLRNSCILKTYIAIFVCMSTKAMHIELVSDASADAFIAALRRVIARRGYIKHLFSDNATCFVSANKLLQEKSEKERDEFNKVIFTELANNNIQWHFSPPAGPHFNGLAEAAVKSVKKHLKKCIGETVLTFEEMCTLLCQIEAAVNSRPLCAISTDPNDVSILTPGHFLMGSAPLAPPEESYIDSKLYGV